MNVLIIQQKMIGDVLISTLLCENIKKWNPSSKIDFIANTHTVPILQNNPNINKIIKDNYELIRKKNILICGNIENTNKKNLKIKKCYISNYPSPEQITKINELLLNNLE